MKVGFLYSETMAGTFYPLGAPADERPMHAKVNIRIPNIVEFIRDWLGRIEGEVTMDGFADGAQLVGTIAFRGLDEYRLPYEFSFTADDGAEYRLRGQRNLNLLSVHESMTTLVSSVYDGAGREIMRANLRLEDRRGELKKLLRSLRFTYLAGGVA